MVLRQDDDFDAVEQRERGGELAGEVVVVEENRFEVDQGGEVRDLAGECVSFEAEDSELVQTVQDLGIERTR